MIEGWPSVAVVIPAYRAADSIIDVIERIPSEVRHIIVVDDASPDDLQTVLAGVRDERVHVVRHEENLGVGGAMKTGFQAALDLDADIVVKVDADGQMDPALVPDFVEPIASGNADVAKGNRFAHLSAVGKMPFLRRLGNIALSFLAKAASGYWQVFDPTNGYIAVNAAVLADMNRERVANTYFFEISFLCEAYFTRAIVEDVPMLPVYGQEVSSLRPMRMLWHFAPRLVGRFIHRILVYYFVRDFNAVSLFLTAGVPTFLFGCIWSLYYWIRDASRNVPTATGTIIIGALTILIGFQLILQATVLDVENEPGRGGREPHRPQRRSVPDRR